MVKALVMLVISILVAVAMGLTLSWFLRRLKSIERELWRSREAYARRHGGGHVSLREDPGRVMIEDGHG